MSDKESIEIDTAAWTVCVPHLQQSATFGKLSIASIYLECGHALEDQSEQARNSPSSYQTSKYPQRDAKGLLRKDSSVQEQKCELDTRDS